MVFTLGPIPAQSPKWCKSYTALGAKILWPVWTVINRLAGQVGKLSLDTRLFCGCPSFVFSQCLPSFRVLGQLLNLPKASVAAYPGARSDPHLSAALRANVAVLRHGIAIGIKCGFSVVPAGSCEGSNLEFPGREIRLAMARMVTLLVEEVRRYAHAEGVTKEWADRLASGLSFFTNWTI